MSEKKEYEKLIETINKKENVIFKIDETMSLHKDALSSGSLALDLALGGGLVLGRLYELYGPESSGKTTIALQAMAAAQAAGGNVLLMDMEHAFDPKYAISLGVNPDTLWIAQPDTQEGCFEIMESMAATGDFALIILDSVAALSPRAELTGDSGDSNMGLAARYNGQHLRKMVNIAAKTRTTVLYINQIRYKIGVTFGSPETTTGGNAFKFFCSGRLDIRRIATIKEGDNATGIRSRVRMVKNKTYIPFLEAEFVINFGKGVDRNQEIVEMATEKGVIEKKGSWYSYKGENMGQGAKGAAEYVEAAGIYDELKEELLKCLTC